MEKYFNLIHQNDLFEGILRKDFETMFFCLSPIKKSYTKNEYILHMGDSIETVGILLSGELKIIKTDIHGNENIVNKIFTGDMFLEVFACADVFSSPVAVISETKSEVLFLNYRKIITSCSSSCVFHQKLISNMLKIIAKKSLFLNEKFDIISKKTLRNKIITYLDYERKGKEKLKINLNREELANFLLADRSALSAELSKMQKENLIKYNKNEFEILY